MSKSARALLVVSALSLFTLIALRIAVPAAIVGTKEGFFLNCATAFLFFYALARSQGLRPAFYGRVGGLVLISWGVAVMLFDWILDLQYFGDGMLSPFGFFWLLPMAIVAAVGWWHVIFRREATLRSGDPDFLDEGPG